MTTDTTTIDVPDELDSPSYDELLKRADELEARFDYGDPDPATAAELRVLHHLTMERQPWTLFSSCTGYPVLYVEANSEVATAVAVALDVPMGVCEQCGDLGISETELPDSRRPVVTCVAVTAAEIDAILNPDG